MEKRFARKIYCVYAIKVYTKNEKKINKINLTKDVGMLITNFLNFTEITIENH